MQSTSSPTEIIQEVFKNGKEVSYKRGDIILRPGDKTNYTYLIVEGFVKVYDISEDGLTNLVIIQTEPDIFAIRHSLYGSPINYFYETINDVKICLIEISKFQTAIDNNARFTKAILEEVLRLSHEYADRVFNLELKTASQRVIYRLLFLSRRFGAQTSEKSTITLPITHQDIAESLNLTRETASKEIFELVKEGLIIQKGRFITIIDTNRLTDKLK